MKIISKSDLSILSLEELRTIHPNISIPNNPGPESLAALDCAILIEDEEPAYNPVYQKIVSTVVESAPGEYLEEKIVTDLPAEESALNFDSYRDLKRQWVEEEFAVRSTAPVTVNGIGMDTVQWAGGYEVALKLDSVRRMVLIINNMQPEPLPDPTMSFHDAGGTRRYFNTSVVDIMSVTIGGTYQELFNRRMALHQEIGQITIDTAGGVALAVSLIDGLFWEED